MFFQQYPTAQIELLKIFNVTAFACEWIFSLIASCSDLNYFDKLLSWTLENNFVSIADITSFKELDEVLLIGQ